MSHRTRVNGCLIDPSTSAAVIRRRTARASLCWQRPTDHERRRRHPVTSLYPRIGRT